MRETYNRLFVMGVALDGNLPADYSAAELELIRRQFAALTPVNCMKMTHLQPEPGRFDFQMADALVAFAASNRHKVCGHCLVWAKDERTPEWIFRDGENPASRDLLLRRMQTHIETIADRYRGKVISWDVVNEALYDGTNFLRSSKWVSTLGEDFIVKAFQFAHQADPEAVLVYNDYNVELPAKRVKLLRLLRLLQEKKAPIQAVGIQGHYELDAVPYQDLEETISAIHSLGLKVMITEFDVDAIPRAKWWADGGKHREELARFNPYAQGCPPDVLQRQAEQYAKLFRIFREHADDISRITFWDLHDGRSWLNHFPWERANYPLLFDREAQPKPAFRAAVAPVAAVQAESQFRDFVRVQGDQLMEEGRPFRFVSWNIPNLHLVEDNIPFEPAGPNQPAGAGATIGTGSGWRWPDRFEMTDALATVRQMGGKVARTYVLSVRRAQDTPGVPRHILGPGQFSEEAFRVLDQVLQVANEQGVRLIIPFVDNWHWWGGRAEYASFRGKTKDDFWTNPQLIADFKQTIRFVLMRTNTLTGARYADDKAILCWETGNELECPPAWTREIAGYIKSLDHNHPVMDGFHTTELREESLAMPEVDIVTTHHYPGAKKTFAQLIRENAARAKGRKPYIVGEFGFVSLQQLTDAIQATRETLTVGALAWSLRFRSRNGGFYWHSEPAGGNKYKAFHWPGSPLADDYDETAFMALMQREAFAIRGLPAPAIPTPAPPILLPVTDPGAISWQGSVGATGYRVERASSQEGPWTVAADGVDEGFTQYRPSFSDETVPKGKCFYRVRAKNAAGLSASSNISGPVEVLQVTLVDELADFSKTCSRSGELEIKSRDCRAAMEDAHRAAGQAGSTLVYRIPSPLIKARVFVFFPKDIADLNFSLSPDGRTFR
ncbi:MAG: endo-1,4-beta-xylanase, partial [Verrucomicrobia bacterium]|nr:endo-1,4-beta-xylanase [Verrucomicrobiota bacterium]